MGGWPAILASLTEEMWPEGAMDQLAEAGLAVSLLAPVALERQAAPEQLAVVWVGTGWEAGLSLLRRVRSARARARMVVWGVSPSLEAEMQVLQEGGLIGVGVPFPAWVVPAALEALQRWDGVPAPELATRLLEDPVRAPEEVLHLLGRELSTQLESSRWTVAVRGASGALEALPRGVGGGPGRGGPRLEHASRLEEALAMRGLVHTPEAGQTTVVLPILAPPAPDAVLALHWPRPFLLNAREVERLRLLMALGRAAWSRAAAEQQLSREQVTSLAALSALPWASGTAADPEPLLERLLRSHLGLPGLEELWALASRSSRAQPRWVVYTPSGGAPTLGERDRSGAARATPGSLPRQLGDGRWLIRQPIEGGGVLVGVWRTQATARAGQSVLSRLGGVVSLGLRLLRRSSDNSALIQLSRVLSEAASARDALSRVAELICAQLDADGVAVYTVESSGIGPQLSLLLETGQATAAPHRCPLSRHQGLEDRVIDQEEWVLVVTPPHDGVVHARTGPAGAPAVVPVRPSSDYWGSRSLPPALRSTQLLVPLHREGSVVGVLAVWRRDLALFDHERDLETMRHLAPHVTHACVRVRGMDRLGGELLATQRLAAALSPDCPRDRAWQSLLEEVCTLTGWPRALLLLHDPSAPLRSDGAGPVPPHGHRRDRSGEPRGSGGSLFFVDVWPPPRAVQPWSAPYRELCLPLWGSAEGWPEAVKSELSTGSPVWAAVLGGNGAESPPQGVVVLLGPEGSSGASASLTPQIDALALESFLRYAAVLLDNHLRAFGRGVVEQIQGSLPAVRTPTQVMEVAAEHLCRALGADLVSIEEPEGTAMVARAIWPVLPEAMSLPTVWREEDSGPSRVLRWDEPTAQGAGLDVAGAEALRRRYGWSRARSWLGISMDAAGRRLGRIQAWTGESGPYLGPDQSGVLAVVARWVEAELRGSLRRQMLEALNVLAHGLAGETGEGLGRQAVVGLEVWLERFLGRRCLVVLLAWTPPAQALLTAHSAALSAEGAAQLQALSREWGETVQRWVSGARLGGSGEGGHRLERAGVACPLRLPGKPALQGHLMMLHRRPFSEEDAQALQEAAREMAHLVHGELMQQDLRYQGGVFRHAMLGPVQGLCSAAQRMGMLARDATATATAVATASEGSGSAVVAAAAAAQAEVLTLTQRIDEEGEVIRLWRDTQRMLATLREGAPLDIRPREQPLRPLVERCLDRYASAFQRRDITTRLEWPVAGALRFAFDLVALDLALSNLLDNARKYAFYHREVVVGAAVEGESIGLWVEDVGSAIPTSLGEAIYELRMRTDRLDPIRAIHGEGLGLFIARAVARAHRGQLTHTCRPEGRGGEDDPLAPHRVRFTLRLPHHWRKP